MKTISTITTLLLLVLVAPKSNAQSFDTTVDFIKKQIMTHNFMRKPVTISENGEISNFNGWQNFNLNDLEDTKKRLLFEWKGANGIYIYKKDLSGGVAPRRFQYEIEFSQKGCVECPVLIMNDQEAALSTYNAFQHLRTILK